MNAPHGPFTPWLEHDLVDGRCVRCGLVPIATVTNDPTKAYTHAGNMTLRGTPMGTIVKCAMLLVMLCWPVQASAITASVSWTPNTEPDLAGYRLYRGFMSCAAQGPMLPLASLGKLSSYTDATIPDGTTVVSVRLSAVDLAGNESPLSACAEKVFMDDPRILKLEAQLAGICRAAKAMGGTATSLAGRLRKEIPCL